MRRGFDTIRQSSVTVTTDVVGVRTTSTVVIMKGVT